MSKDLIFFSDVVAKLKSGVSKIARAVKGTLGPTGRVVMIGKEYGYPSITKDGVTVAKSVELPDPLENMAAQMVHQAAAKTAQQAGDGTTTATIYVESIFNAGLKYIEAGAKPQEIRDGINIGVRIVVDKLIKMAKPIKNIEEIRQVAKCSANQDETIGDLVAEAMDKVGAHGVITIEEGINTSVKVVEGLRFDRGYLLQHFANKDDGACEFENPYIILCDYSIDDFSQIARIIEQTRMEQVHRPLVIVADNMSDNLLTLLALNKVQGRLKICVVKAPGLGDRKFDVLSDIAAAIGGVVVSKMNGEELANLQLQKLGMCKKIIITRDQTTILHGAGDKKSVEARIALIQELMAKTPGNFDREQLQDRLARLTGGVAQISVSGVTESEMRERKDRVDDALNACKAATEEGILPGGGVAVLRAKEDLLIARKSAIDDVGLGIDIINKAIEAHIRQIAENSGVDAGAILAKVLESADQCFGYDAASSKYCDMVSSGIIVPTKVERVALENAASIASMLLVTNCMISVLPDANVQK